MSAGVFDLGEQGLFSFSEASHHAIQFVLQGFYLFADRNGAFEMLNRQLSQWIIYHSFPIRLVMSSSQEPKQLSVPRKLPEPRAAAARSTSFNAIVGLDAANIGPAGSCNCLSNSCLRKSGHDFLGLHRLALVARLCHKEASSLDFIGDYRSWSGRRES